MRAYSFKSIAAATTALSALSLAAGPAAAQSSGEPSPTSSSVSEVVVSASRRPQPIEQLGSSVSVVSADVIEQQQLKTLDQVLARTPGVTIVRSGGIGQNTQVRMRGFTTKHVLTMIDGVKLNNPSEADNQYGLEHIFLDDVERVEVLRGPQSGLYGGDASAGVINVITRRPMGDPMLRLSALYGDHDTYELSAASQGRVKGLGYSVGGTWYDTGGISLASRAPGNIERDGYQNFTASGRVDWDASDSLNLEAWLRYTDSENEIDDAFLPANNPQRLPGFLYQDSPGSVQSEQLFGVLKGRLSTFGGRLVHAAQVSMVDIQSDYVTPVQRQESEGRTTEALYYATYDLAGGAYLLGGVEHKREQGRFQQPTGGGFATVDDAISETGWFATFNLTPAEGAWLSGAVRYDNSSLFGGDTTWRLTGAYNLPDRFNPRGVSTKLRASYGTGAEAPGLRQLLGASPTYRGNPDLRPEESHMWDVGVDQSLLSGFGGWSVTYYQGRADNGIFNTFNPATGISSPQNIAGAVEMMGVEIEGRLHPARWIDLTVNYTDSSSRTLADGRQLFGRPKQEGSASITVRPIEAVAITLDGYWRGEFFSDYPTNYQMPGYGVASLSLSWLINQRLKLNARLQNIFDKVYEEKLGDSTYGRTGQVRLTANF